MIYDLSKNNPYDRQKFIDRVNELLEKGCAVSLTKKAPQRSLAQNRLLYLWLGFFACEFGYSLDEAKWLFKTTVNPDIFVRTKINKYGRAIQCLRSSADLTTAEMTTALDRFRNYAASVCGIYIATPDDRQFLLHCEKVIEQNKEFILQQNEE